VDVCSSKVCTSIGVKKLESRKVDFRRSVGWLRQIGRTSEGRGKKFSIRGGAAKLAGNAQETNHKHKKL